MPIRAILSHNNPVPASLFGSIERGIGSFENFRRGFAVLWKDSHTNRGGEVLLETIFFENQVMGIVVDFHGAPGGFFKSRFGKNNDNFIAAIAAGSILAAKVGCQISANLL